jgi:hypothetical protein
MTTGPVAGFPLPLRNALAALTIAALDAADARAALAWLADGADDSAPLDLRPVLAARHLVGADGMLLEVHRPHVDRIRAHATRALRAAAAFDARSADGRVAAAVARAITLWNERLFFEVHEVLEAEWVRASGSERQALQGVIQIAVALHHHAHGNPRGARTLMREGRERLAACAAALPVLDVPALLAATSTWEAALRAGTRPPEVPRLAPRDGPQAS